MFGTRNSHRNASFYYSFSNGQWQFYYYASDQSVRGNPNKAGTVLSPPHRVTSALGFFRRARG